MKKILATLAAAILTVTITAPVAHAKDTSWGRGVTSWKDTSWG